MIRHPIGPRTVVLYQDGDLIPYRLPCGRLVHVAYWACRGELELEMQTADGMVTALRDDEAA